MGNKQNNAIEASSEILKVAKEEIALLLIGSEHGTLALGIESSLTRLINNLNFVSGQVQVAPVNVNEQFQPVTEVMGIEIKQAKEVVKEDLLPKDDDKTKFLDKVNDLQANFLTLDNTKILEEFVTKEDKAAIRGVAKRAGLADFKSATIDSTYLDLIKDGLKNLEIKKTDKVKAEAIIDKATAPSENKDK